MMRTKILVLLFVLAAGCATVLRTVRPAREGQFPMPDLTGKTKGQVEETLAAEGKTGGLDVQETDCKDEAVKEGTVCGQTPEPGQTTQAGGPTLVYVQSRRNPRMPDVIGKDPEEAKKILAQGGFHDVDVRTLETPRAGCVPKHVCSTVPEPGVRASLTTQKVLWLQPAPDASPPHADHGASPPDTRPPEEKPPEDKPPDSVF